ncbi:hypothetical protein [Haloquadratum walsbyi]|uniref:Uncharacterized protein n=1 Tax=Haloquadratum walsbyi J07HQW2 TaxID=1238425 RepID=U1PNC0_9EURY|nr:hypothetical protein [Haloquadratum walsbyi]ERG93746.1 MAG: hypothetical protein J07HQW2_00180 [Haloquadratum walsbyi J07HQW2]
MVFQSVDEPRRWDYAFVLFFGALTIGCILLMIRALLTGSSSIQLILLGGLMPYILILTLDAHDKVDDLKRVSLIPLGIVGVVTFLSGHAIDLPILSISFSRHHVILLAVGSFLDLALTASSDSRR